MQEIEISIDKDGNVQTEIAGVEGGKCLELTKVMEELLGGVILERQYKREFYLQNTVEEQEKIARKKS